MEQARSDLVIGIDGGGTSCRFALLAPHGRFETTLGGANVHTDQKRALHTLTHGLEILSEKSGLSADALRGSRAYAGLAGILNHKQAEEIGKHLPLDHLHVEDDRCCAVAGALGSADGFVAGLGTGSFLARQSNGFIRLIGGYGADIGDEASGCWLGKMLLAKVLHCRDGLADPSDLTRKTWADFDEDLARLLTFAKTAKPSEFGQFAPDILGAAEQGDANACALLQSGADYIVRCLEALGWSAGARVCFIGGLGPAYQSYLPTAISSCIVPAGGTALDGALMLAQMGSRCQDRQLS
ncbi:BadF/BadG/BcrA/BcrD ATPase family protein [Roseibium sp. RKSG952]|uniref:BadF/BadG/BcrA/BcrD ATPase family protein n=1 Tax=Roseibium sp. RKSG952 TaxID=2529384 RepID=UPI0012BC4E37|nr:BadF/BadG/BcrA/BcrD ATPase family protein [Roseibium sp. RKSG952]MTH99085.1 ATPase [Roseibium sp. RKSG952]